MTTESIRRKVRSLKRKYCTSDPVKFCEKAGINLYFRDDFRKLRGMYAVILRSRCIFINSNLSDEEMKMTIAHEIGHDYLHRDLAKAGVIRDQMLIDMKMKPEYEANLFAAEFLIDDDDIFSIEPGETDVFEAGKMLSVDPSLVTLKLRILKDAGMDFNDTYFDPDFIK